MSHNLPFLIIKVLIRMCINTRHFCVVFPFIGTAGLFPNTVIGTNSLLPQIELVTEVQIVLEELFLEEPHFIPISPSLDELRHTGFSSLHPPMIVEDFFAQETAIPALEEVPIIFQEVPIFLEEVPIIFPSP